MLEIGPVLDGSNHGPRRVAKRITDASGKSRNDRIPIAQAAQEPIHVAMLRIPGIVANPHRNAGGSQLVEQFDERKMGLQEIRLASKFRVARILSLAERMPGIITASSRGKLDRIALAEQ